MKLNRVELLVLFAFTASVAVVCSLVTNIISKSNKDSADPSDIYNDNVKKVVEVCAYNNDDEDNKSFGTGWFISNNTLVTNYHVISYLIHEDRESFDNIEIRFFDEEAYTSVEVNYYDFNKDIALLKYSGSHERGLFELNFDSRTGDKCYTIGNYLNHGLSIKEGTVSLSAVKMLYNNEYNDFIQCALNVGQGDSGAPLLNSNNTVIGMITFRGKNNSGNVEQGYCYAIPAETIFSANALSKTTIVKDN